jgi:predicted nucleic acid-binding protein
MATTYILDTGPLGLLAHRRPAVYRPIRSWILQEKAAGATIYISEVADYEVRRELARMIRAGKLPPSRIQRLDQIAAFCPFLPVTSIAWRKAAEFWAEARSQGLPTAHPDALDADALIAAQADEMQATVVTANPSHIGRWVPVHPWP